MKPNLISSNRWQTTARALTIRALCLLTMGRSLFGAPPATKSRDARQKQGQISQIQGDERVLHALNRFTFGPTPDDLAAVQAMGLKRWFERQLNPSNIDDSALERRLDNFPAMRLSQEALMQRFPSPPVLRQMEKQNLPLPTDPLEHAIYADQMAFYAMAQQKKATGKVDLQGNPEDVTRQNGAKGNGANESGAKGNGEGSAVTMLPGNTVDPFLPAMTARVEQLYSGLEAMKTINLSPDQRMQRILTMSPEELVAFHQSLTPQDQAAAAQGLSPEQKEILTALPGSFRVVNGELVQSRLVRDIYSDRQLEAVMTDFWLNHFNIDRGKNQNEPYLLSSFERDVIRPNALGSFESLLVATAKSPAMLVYLDNWLSIGPESQAAQRSAQQQQRNPDARLKARPNGLNENYARELMELHTLGVNGGYTQADVIQVARAFTGWTIERPNQGAAFHFEPNRHEPGAKYVLGATIQPEGEAEGLQVLHVLATSPATAKFISTKLAVRFVSDAPSPALIDRMSKSFLASGGDIKTVLRTLFNAPEFWSRDVYRAKVKTPLEFVVSAIRASDAQVTNAQPLVQSLDRFGMPLYGMQTPNGYGWTAEPWVSTGALVSRMNFALSLTGDRMQGVRTGLEPRLNLSARGVQPASFLRVRPGADREMAMAAKEKRLELLLLGQPVSPRTRETVLRQVADSYAQPQTGEEIPIKANRPVQGADASLGGRIDTSPGDSSQRHVAEQDREAAMMAGLLLGSPEFQRR